jgi:multidrug resistance efflux pump
MKLNRIVTLAVVAGVVTVAVTFLTAANTSSDANKSTQDSAKPVDGSGVVVFANLDVESGIILIFPETFPQPARVDKILVKEGQSVVKDQALIELDKKLAKMTLDEAEAAITTAQNLLAQAEAMHNDAKQKGTAHLIAMEAQQIAIDSKKKLLEAAKTKLAEQRKRAADLGIKNEPEINAAQFNLESAQKDVEFEEKKLAGLKRVSPQPLIDAAQSKVDEANSGLKRQQIQKEKAQYGLDAMTVRAPCDGKVLRIQCQVGLTVGVQSKQPLILFQPAEKLIIRCEVDQEWASRVQLNQAAIINDDNDASLEWKGKVTKIADAFLPKRALSGMPEGFPMTDSRVLEVIVELNKDQKTDGLRLNQRLKVKIGMDSGK